MENQINQNYTQIFNNALYIANQAHQGQVDKGGNPYILHPLRMMLQFEEETLQIIALLHDVIEDSAWTLEDLQRYGFSREILQAVSALTKHEHEEYKDFIARVAKNNLAVKVKIADLQDNLNITRLQELSDKDLQRIKKYHQALILLKSLCEKK